MSREQRCAVIGMLAVLGPALALGGCRCGGPQASPTDELTAPEAGMAAEAGGPEVDTTPGARPVSFEVDNVQIRGKFWPAGEPDRPALLLVHQLGSTQEEWSPLIERLRRQHPSWALLTINLRGHGDSITRRNETIRYQNFSEEEWRQLPHDIEAALQFLRGPEGGQPSVIGLVGSSIGSSAVLLALTDELRASPQPPVRSLVLLSPGLGYHGLETARAMERVAEASIPTLAIAAADDQPSTQALERLDRQGSAVTTLTLPGTAHGVELAQEHAELFARVTGFLNQHLTAPPPAES